VIGVSLPTAGLKGSPEDVFISREPIRSAAGYSFQSVITGIVDKGSVAHVAVNVPPEFTWLVTGLSADNPSGNWASRSGWRSTLP
jgi:hypothetical protein